MNYRCLVIFALITVLCLSFAACGGGADTDTSSVGESVVDTPNVDVGQDSVSDPAVDTESADTEEAVVSMLIGENDIRAFSVYSSDDAIAGTILSYFTDKVKSITSFDLPVASDPSSVENVIVIEESSELGKDEFVIEVKDGDLYISFSEGATAYQAITAVLDDSLFSKESGYALESDFDFCGICEDYMIGDNEFNPFE